MQNANFNITKAFLHYCCAAIIGISLGLIGGGGSILTIPVLVYLFNISPVIATSYSLFIVGITSFVGAYNNIRKGFVHFPTVFSFGIPSVITVLIVRKLIVHKIPEHLFSIGSVDISFSFLIMVLLALLMLFAAFSVIRNENVQLSDFPHHKVKFIFYFVFFILNPLQFF